MGETIDNTGSNEPFVADIVFPETDAVFDVVTFPIDAELVLPDKVKDRDGGDDPIAAFTPFPLLESEVLTYNVPAPILAVLPDITFVSDTVIEPIVAEHVTPVKAIVTLDFTPFGEPIANSDSEPNPNAIGYLSDY